MADSHRTPFNALIAQSIVAHTDILPEQLIIVENSAKYCPNDSTENAADEKHNLSAIVDTMAKLNFMAMKDPNLCAGEQGPSFRETLFSSVSELAKLVGSRPLRYIELGPEPFKSHGILTVLLAAGVQLRQYVGVDINPASQEVMRQKLMPLIGTERFTYLIADYYECSRTDFPKPMTTGTISAEGQGDDMVTIITNLGFQEGNDLPSRTGPMLERLMRPGDLLLSEMQVLHDSPNSFEQVGTDGVIRAAAIERFYRLPEMRRFSLLIAQRFSKSNSSSDAGRSSPELKCNDNSNYDDCEQQLHEPPEYLFNLVPLRTDELVGFVNVAATLISVRVDGGVKKYLLTNSCLKYTQAQFHQVRETSGNFRVMKSLETGDKSVVFQIAERR